MNPILTDEDRREIHRKTVLACNPVDALIDETEAAVLAKLREQEPLFYYRLTCNGEMCEGPIWAKSARAQALMAASPPSAWKPLYPAPQPAVVQVPPLTEDQIKRHSMLAADCPGASAVILVSSLRRLLAAAPAAPVRAVKPGAVDEFNRVIQHAITLGAEAPHFLRCWNEGDWDGCREFEFKPSLPYELQPPALPTDVCEALKVAREALAAAEQGLAVGFGLTRVKVKAAIERIDALGGAA